MRKILTDTGIELMEGILVFLLESNEEEVLCDVGRWKFGEWLLEELKSSGNIKAVKTFK